MAVLEGYNVKAKYEGGQLWIHVPDVEATVREAKSGKSVTNAQRT